MQADRVEFAIRCSKLKPQLLWTVGTCGWRSMHGMDCGHRRTCQVCYTYASCTTFGQTL